MTEETEETESSELKEPTPSFREAGSLIYMPMHEVTPKVVAMAVNTVITTCRILLQIDFSMTFLMFDV